MLMYFTLIVRIILGPFSLFGVVAYHYLFRGLTVALSAMLMFNRLTTSVFILNFQWIEAVPEHRVMPVLECTPSPAPWPASYRRQLLETGVDWTISVDGTCTSTWARLYVLFKLVVIMICCVQGNISDKIRNTAGTGDLLIFPFLGLCLASLACTACKFLTKPSLLQRYRSGIVESTANGTVNCFCLVGVLIGISGSISTTVRQVIPS